MPRIKIKFCVRTSSQKLSKTFLCDHSKNTITLRSLTWTAIVSFLKHKWAKRPKDFPFLMVRHPLVGLCLLCEVLRSHSDIPHSVGLLRKSDKSVAETSNWQHTTFERDRYLYPGGIRTRNPSKRAAVNPRVRPHGYWRPKNRPGNKYITKIYNFYLKDRVKR